MSPDFVLSAYQAGNGECTVDFVKKLLARNKLTKLLLIWDGAIYHRGQEMQEFLAQHFWMDYLPMNGELLVSYFRPMLPKKIRLKRFGYN